MFGVIPSILLSVVPFLLVLTLVITVHELGHFLVARGSAWRWTVSPSISAAPSSAAPTSRASNGGSAWIPLGGYVRFAGDGEASSSVPDGESLEKLRSEIVAREGVQRRAPLFPFQAGLGARPGGRRRPGSPTSCCRSPCSPSWPASPATWWSRPARRRRRPELPGREGGLPEGRHGHALDGRKITDFFELKQYVMLRAGEPIRSRSTAAASTST